MFPLPCSDVKCLSCSSLLRLTLCRAIELNQFERLMLEKRKRVDLSFSNTLFVPNFEKRNFKKQSRILFLQLWCLQLYDTIYIPQLKNKKTHSFKPANMTVVYFIFRLQVQLVKQKIVSRYNFILLFFSNHLLVLIIHRKVCSPMSFERLIWWIRLLLHLFWDGRRPPCVVFIALENGKVKMFYWSRGCFSERVQEITWRRCLCCTVNIFNIIICLYIMTWLY